jgi:hypothetical protein
VFVLGCLPVGTPRLGRTTGGLSPRQRPDASSEYYRKECHVRQSELCLTHRDNR